MNITDIENLIWNRAKAQKKISRVDEIEASLKNILKVIDYINELPEDTTYLSDWNRSFDDIPILNEFAMFIQPDSVRVNVNDRSNINLMKRNDDPGKIDISYTDYINSCDTFRGMFKKDAFSDVTPLSNIRKKVSLFDVIDKVIGENLTLHVNSGQVYWPVFIDPGISKLLFEKRYFNDDIVKLDESVKNPQGFLYDIIANINFI